MMNVKSIQSTITSLLSAATLAVVLVPAAHASTVSLNLHASMPTKAKAPAAVALKVRNDSNAAVQLHAGDQDITVAAGQTMDLKLAVGARIVTASTSAKHEAGTVLCEVSSALSGATVVVN
jgi:hypothetical protein